MNRLLLAMILLLLPAASGAEILHRPDPEVEAGIAALEAGDAEEALARFDRAARRRPGQGEIHLNRGLALRELGRLDEAQEAFGQALAAGGAGREALHGLGHLHAARGDLERAIASFKSALARDPEDAVARRNLEALLRQRQESQEEQEDEGKEDRSEDDEESDEGEDESSGDQGEGDEGNEESESPEEGGEAEQESGDSEQGQEESGEQDSSSSGETGQEEGDDAGASQAEPGEDGDSENQADAGGRAAQEAPEAPSETERILDALKAREKSLQLFQGQQRQGRRTDAEKDW